MCSRKCYYRKFEPLHFVWIIGSGLLSIVLSSEHGKFHFFDALFRISIVRRNNSWNWSISRRKWCSTYYCGDENCSGDGATFQNTSIGLDNECSMRNNIISIKYFWVSYFGRTDKSTLHKKLVICNKLYFFCT